MNAFAGDDTPPTVATTATSPLGVEAGIWTLIWYSPVATRPANVGVTVTPPIRTVTSAIVFAEPVSNSPSGIAGVVAPNPLPNSSMVSPGLAGVDNPGYRLAGPSKVLSACSAAMYLSLLKMKNAGATACIVVPMGSLVAPL